MLIPGEFIVNQNFPNPFNQTTEVRFSVPRDCHIRVRIFNSLGQIVSSPFEGEVKAHQIKSVFIDGKNLSSGIYLCNVEFEGRQIAKKMMLIK
jgi:hypothetical protein